MTAEQWIERFAAAIDAEVPTAGELEAILELAAVAAHGSERIAAPIACWLAGTTRRPIAELRTIADAIV